MSDKQRPSIALSVGLKASTAISKFRGLLNQPSFSSLSNLEDGKDERIEIQNLLRLEDLEKLRLQGFSEDKVLNKEQFIAFLRRSLTRGTDRDYDELFECVDVTKEGFVSWEKLAEYIVLKLTDNDDRQKATSIPNWKGGKTLLNAHRDSIKRMQHMDSFGRYISMSKEGTVCIYNDEMQLYKTFKAATESCKVRDLWVTDFVFMPNNNKIAIAYTSKELIIYDMTSKLELNLSYRIVGMTATPYCLDYWSDPENPNDAILSWGDVEGNVHAIFFNSALIALIERPAQQTSDAEYTRVKLEDIANRNYKNASYLTYHAHGEWTRKVKYAEYLECFISCSTHTKTALAFGWMEKSGLTVRNSDVVRDRSNYAVRVRGLREIVNKVSIDQGVNSFDYSRHSNLIATAGANNDVCLWNPFVLSKPNGTLRGHMRSVLFVQFIHSRGQILSFSKDKILRIWDVQLQICLQRISNIFPRGPEVEILCWFDDPRSRLFTTFRTNILMWEIKPDVKNRIVTHERAIVAARYLLKHKQVMVLCQAGDVSFWSLEGQKTNRFSGHSIGENIDTTCLGFDEFGEKFYTGGSDGKIRIWNYNGRILRTLDAGNNTAVEITQIETLKRRILAVGWSKYLTVFRDLQQVETKPSAPTEWKGDKDEEKREGHAEDIVCLAVTTFSPQLLASGSTDGEICIWNTSSELFIRRLDQRKRNPNHTQTRLQDNAADFAITRLCFLDKRITSSTTSSSKGANLSSCGGLGFVRFWNVHTGKLLGEFQAHNDVSTIIMEIDVRNKHLGTGDLNGLVKIWDIEQYCLQSNSSDIETNLPPLLAEFTSHPDSITCIDFLEKDGRTFILTSSSDGSVVLSDINGNPYGIFGQPNHWHLDADLSKIHDEELELVQSQHDDNSQENSRIFDDESQVELNTDFDHSPPMTDEEMLTRRSNVWESTSIGVSYREKRTNRRQRNQPTLITTKDYQLWEKTGLAPGGAYGSLDTYDPPNIPEQKKLPHANANSLLHSNTLGDNTRRRPVPTTIGGNLKSAFDERSIFPKYILDYEIKQRQAFELTNQTQPLATMPTTSTTTNPQLHLRQAADSLLKLKRQNSTTALLSDQKAQ